MNPAAPCASITATTPNLFARPLTMPEGNFTSPDELKVPASVFSDKAFHNIHLNQNQTYLP